MPRPVLVMDVSDFVGQQGLEGPVRDAQSLRMDPDDLAGRIGGRHGPRGLGPLDPHLHASPHAAGEERPLGKPADPFADRGVAMGHDERRRAFPEHQRFSFVR